MARRGETELEEMETRGSRMARRGKPGLSEPIGGWEDTEASSLADWSAIILPDRVSEGSGAHSPGQDSAVLDTSADIDPPDAANVKVFFSPTLVLERLDSSNWGLRQRVVVTGTGANAGRGKWVTLGFYGTPGKCRDKLVALRVVEESPLSVSALEAAATYRAVEGPLDAGLLRAERADAVERARGDIAARAREEALREAAQLVTDDAQRRAVLALVKRR